MPPHALGRADGSTLSLELRTRPAGPRPSLPRSPPADQGESAAPAITIRAIAAFFPRVTPYPSTISKSLKKRK